MKDEKGGEGGRRFFVFVLTLLFSLVFVLFCFLSPDFGKVWIVLVIRRH